ncbi:MAG: response regulator [Anaerolineae bacterium]|nr:MAG: response regulator [Anaerolineae bacterium]
MVKILVIEDDVELCDGICRLLQGFGYSTIFANDGVAGIEMALRHRPNVIVCDSIMPDMDGFATYAALQADPKRASIPFILMLPINYDGPMEALPPLYLLKPFKPEALRDMVESALQ